MAEAIQRRARSRSQAAASPKSAAADEAERRLGRTVALGLPGLTLLAAAGVGVVGGLPSALLVLASGVLLGAIALLWTSVRTLSGDAPLAAALEGLSARGSAVDSLVERKHRVLQSLKDVEGEHSLGKLDDADYNVFVTRYREEAKSLMREIDRQAEPKRDEAERVARDYLQRHGLGADSDVQAEGSGRICCSRCGASNESDAAFCKGCGAAVTRTETV